MKRENKRSLTKDVLEVLHDVGHDAVHCVHYWRHNLRGNRVGKKYISGDSLHPPVILLQGFLGTRGVLHPLEAHLRAQGRDVISLDLGMFNISDIRKSAQLLSYKMERLMDRFSKQHRSGRFDIIGHSMGGLIGLYYVKRLGGHRITRKLITLGAPFHGTWVSLLALLPFGLFSKGIWQMLPPAPFLKTLTTHTDEGHETEVISLSARYDTICPPRTCHLHGAHNEAFPVGHAGLLLDKRVFSAITHHLNIEKDSNILAFRSRKK